jgi:hypothetical protein
MNNKYGVDVPYFTKELAALSRSLPDRTPDELERYLLRLSEVAKKSVEYKTVQQNENQKSKPNYTSQAEHSKAVMALTPIWKEYCDQLFNTWQKQHPSVLFIWNPRWQFDHDIERTKSWYNLCTEEGNKWWGEHGYKLQWPENANDPLGVILIVDSESKSIRSSIESHYEQST